MFSFLFSSYRKRLLCFVLALCFVCASTLVVVFFLFVVDFLFFSIFGEIF